MDTAKQESFDLFLLGQTYGNAAFDRATNILQPNVMRGKKKEAFKGFALINFCATYFRREEFWKQSRNRKCVYIRLLKKFWDICS